LVFPGGREKRGERKRKKGGGDEVVGGTGVSPSGSHSSAISLLRSYGGEGEKRGKGGIKREKKGKGVPPVYSVRVSFP